MGNLSLTGSHKTLGCVRPNNNCNKQLKLILKKESECTLWLQF